MLIFYFTTSLENNDFNNLQEKWKISLNTSNQCFHNKMIKALAVTNEVHVISLRPYNKNLVNGYSTSGFETKKGNITYHYLTISTSKFDVFSYKKEAIKIIDKYKNHQSVFITDTINLKCLLLAKGLAKKFKIPLIGICTDLPSNITGAGKLYVKFIENKAKKLDGYISLTDKLNKFFNKNDKNHLIINGIVDNEINTDISNTNYGKYFFYGGTLLEKFGVYNLIDAFNQLNDSNYNLVLCGHHYNETALKKAFNNNSNIYFLGVLPSKKVIELEKNAFANINPRPTNNELDELSIPSKTLEYLNSGKITISNKNKLLYEIFANDIIWTNTDDSRGLVHAMKKIIEMDPETKNTIEKSAKEKCLKLYSINSISQKLNDFLMGFFK